ncbi:MAG: phage holin family protein [Candidatus Gracilibacteria bacterium]
MRFLVHLIVSALAIFLTAYLFPNSVVVTGFGTAIIVAIILAVLNAVVRPILLLLSLPLNVLTLGLFTFVINAIIILLASGLSLGFHVDNFITALLFSIVLSVINALLLGLLGVEE